MVLPIIGAVVFGFLLLVLINGIKIVQEYERAVIFRLGRSRGAKGPGIFFIIPIIDQMVRVNLQEVAVPVSPQQVITRDNVTLKLDAVAFLQVKDPVAAVVQVRDWYQASALVAQTTLRSVIGHHDLDALLTDRSAIDGQLRTALDRQTEDWGIEVRRVELRDVDLPEQIQRAMGRQAEAERDRRAKIISAAGELQAAEQLAEAAEMMTVPGAMQLRTLQTMAEIATERNSTIIFPIPTEVMDAFRAFSGASSGDRAPVAPRRAVPSSPAEGAVAGDPTDAPSTDR